MSTTDPVVNRLANTTQTSASGNYEADLARMRADLNTLLGTKLSQLSINPGKNWLYQRPYPDAYDLVPYPTGWRVPDFIKFSGDDVTPSVNRSANPMLNSIIMDLSSLLALIKLHSILLFSCVRPRFSS